MEGVLVILSGKELNEITTKDYEDILDKMDFKPRIEVLND